MNNNYDQQLYHFGIKGQRWGVRRYQNSDGSLTKAGKQRYRVNNDGKMDKKGHKRYVKDIAKKYNSELNNDRYKAFADSGYDPHRSKQRILTEKYNAKTSGKYIKKYGPKTMKQVRRNAKIREIGKGIATGVVVSLAYDAATGFKTTKRVAALGNVTGRYAMNRINRKAYQKRARNAVPKITGKKLVKGSGSVI